MIDSSGIRLVRHATLKIEYAGRTLLVDPMLSDAGVNPPIEDSPNDRRNPLVDLPDFDLSPVDSVLVTHLHSDHFDDAAIERLPPSMPIVCQPADAEEIRQAGFETVSPVEDATEFGDIQITRTTGQHGHGELADAMGPVAGFVLDAPGEPTVYLAGDTVWYEAVAETIDRHDPDVIVVNAGAAQFTAGRPITMTDADVAAVCEAAPEATVVAAHMEAINHCLQTREELAEALAGSTCEGSLAIPEDGQRVAID